MMNAEAGIDYVQALMAVILQMTFSNVVSWMKTFEFQIYFIKIFCWDWQ